MKHLVTLPILVLVVASLAPLCPVEAVDWRPSEEGICDGTTIDSTAGEYYPLQVGNTWTYALGDNKFVMKVVAFEQVGGLRCAKVEMQDGAGKALSYEHIAVQKDGIYRVSFEGHQAEPPVKILPQPAAVGTQWQVRSTIAKEKMSGTFKCGRQAQLKVGDKVYDTLYTESDDLDANGLKAKFKSYYARNVGMVKQTITIGAQEVVIELEKFEPGK